MTSVKYTKEEFQDEVKRIYELKGIMNTKVFKEETTFDCDMDYFFHKFGGLRSLCKELSIPFTSAKRVDKNALIEDILRVYKENDNYISVEVYDRCGKFSNTCIKNNFDGSFNNMLKQLNLPINMYKNVTREEVIQDVSQFFGGKEYVSSTDYRRNGKYSQSTIDSLFGSWKGLMEELNLPYSKKSYGTDEMLNQVENVYKKYGFINKTLIDEECEFTYQALMYHFDDRKELCEIFNNPNLFSETLSAKATILERMLKILYGEENIETEKTWEWLRNPETNNHLFIDFYITHLNIAIEYDGIQHENHYTSFHRTEDDFLRAKRRDEHKNELLRKNSIPLIRIKHDDILTERFVNNLVIHKVMEMIRYEAI